MKIFEIITENNGSDTIALLRHIAFAFAEKKGKLNVLCAEKIKHYLDDAFDAIEIVAIPTANRRINLSISSCDNFLEFINDTNSRDHSSQYDSYIDTDPKVREVILKYKKFEKDATTFVLGIKNILEQTLLDIENKNFQPALEKIKFVLKQCREKRRELFPNENI